MARRRRFRVESLASAAAGAQVVLPPDEAKHARVLRLQAGAELELFDADGRAWLAELAGHSGTVVLRAPVETQAAEQQQASGVRVVLATAWPKGKRAAVLVEKCAELGVDEIIPLRCARSVVVKDNESEGVERLRRIAAEAAKQSGRNNVPVISDERGLPQLLADPPGGALCVLLDPRARASLAQALSQIEPAAAGACAVLLLIGPEGGFTAAELELADQTGVQRARLGRHVLRVETACVAACAVCAAVLA